MGRRRSYVVWILDRILNPIIQTVNIKNNFIYLISSFLSAVSTSCF